MLPIGLHTIIHNRYIIIYCRLAFISRWLLQIVGKMLIISLLILLVWNRTIVRCHTVVLLAPTIDQGWT